MLKILTQRKRRYSNTVGPDSLNALNTKTLADTLNLHTLNLDQASVRPET